MHKLSKLASALLLGALISLPAMAAEKAKPAATGTVATRSKRPCVVCRVQANTS